MALASAGMELGRTRSGGCDRRATVHAANMDCTPPEWPRSPRVVQSIRRLAPSMCFDDCYTRAMLRPSQRDRETCSAVSHTSHCVLTFSRSLSQLLRPFLNWHQADAKTDRVVRGGRRLQLAVRSSAGCGFHAIRTHAQSMHGLNHLGMRPAIEAAVAEAASAAVLHRLLAVGRGLQPQSLFHEPTAAIISSQLQSLFISRQPQS